MRMPCWFFIEQLNKEKMTVYMQEAQQRGTETPRKAALYVYLETQPDGQVSRWPSQFHTLNNSQSQLNKGAESDKNRRRFNYIVIKHVCECPLSIQGCSFGSELQYMLLYHSVLMAFVLMEFCTSLNCPDSLAAVSLQPSEQLSNVTVQGLRDDLHAVIRHILSSYVSITPSHAVTQRRFVKKKVVSAWWRNN